MEVRLVLEEGRKRRVFTLPATGGVVGRAKGNAVRVPSAEVSRQHCRIAIKGDLVTIEDLGSVNGTFVNGEQLELKKVLRPGDRLEVGPVTLVVEYELMPDALDKLRGDEEPELLELDPGDVIAVDEEEAEVEVELDLPALPADEDEGPRPWRAADDPDLAALAKDEVRLDFTFDKPWQMPEADDLRDLLSGMADEEEKPKKKKQ
jgi:pSer/pThr/pTyr-binding forkhead associated (FHA) protein